MTTVKLLGINDDVTTCECCGRAGLKKTVVLDIEGTGQVHYGTSCAARTLRFGACRLSAKKIEQEAVYAAIDSRYAYAGSVFMGA